MLNIIKNELLKIRSLKATIIAFMMPLVMVLIGLINVYTGKVKVDNMWDALYTQSTILYGGLLLPLVICLIVSLSWRIEYKNNSIICLKTTPIDLNKLFIGKIITTSIIVLLNVVCYIIIIIVFKTLIIPNEPIKSYVFTGPIIGLICTFPLICIQHLLSMTFKNFILPVGFGVMFTFLSFLVQGTKVSLFIPACYIYKGFFFGVANVLVQFSNSILILVPLVCFIVLFIELKIFRKKETYN
ncbi:ABC transporter permease [Clostridium estertheticum]|uniref:ABC transporter permease n=1 Tax=Clostridium estertheticum TaxID=238834 RepID=UPI001C6E0C66|nr:ABC transporter permease [Clostridium estertheticum]MBW9171641.1 ABC transporter permease [Clostridium estertheticum]WLC77132.1 ABC transporter permease [Clostridium estertheticum]